MDTKNISLTQIEQNTLFKEKVLNKNYQIIDSLALLKVDGFVSEQLVSTCPVGSFAIQKTSNFDKETVVVVNSDFVKKLDIPINTTIFCSEDSSFYKLTNEGWVSSTPKSSRSQDIKPRIGDIKYSFLQQDHDGWILCDGRALSKSVYANLWSIYKSFIVESNQSRVSTYTSDDLFIIPNATSTHINKSGSSADYIYSRFLNHSVFIYSGVGV